VPYYLDTYGGAGTRPNPFRPTVDDTGAAYDSIDLRPDPAKTAGFALVWTPNTLTGGKAPTKLADDAGTASAQLVTTLQNRLGINLGGGSMTLRAVVAELLINQGRLDGTRWAPLAANNLGRLQIWLGGQFIYDAPAAAGAAGATRIVPAAELDLLERRWHDPELARLAAIACNLAASMASGSESFNKANSTTLGPDQTWTELVGDAEVLSNQGHIVTVAGASNLYFRCEFDTLSVNIKVKYTLVSLTAGVEFYVTCRNAAAATTHYTFSNYLTATGAGGTDRKIRKVVAGGETNLATLLADTSAVNDVISVSANGSTIVGAVNGTAKITVTDTGITTGTRGGWGGYRNASGNDFAIDNFNVASFPGGIIYTPRGHRIVSH
jgi:hypothetical protein